MLRSLSILHNTSVDSTSGAYYSGKTGRIDCVNASGRWSSELRFWY